MKYRSSRGGGEEVSFSQAILNGYAADGGLYMPVEIPQITDQEFQEWENYTYPQLATAIMHKFIGDEMPFDDLKNMMTSIYSLFEHEEVVPLPKVGDYFVMELFHGPSWSFKDFGQQTLCRLLDYFAERRDVKCSLLVSTTGDTGPAAIAAVLACKRLQLVCTFPSGQISDLQERQIITPVAKNVTAVRYAGGGDDMDYPIKTILTDTEFAREYGIGSVNSINIGRVSSQTVNYVWGYLQMKKQGHDVFSVPTGAMGNIAAGYLAHCMGVPTKRFVCGVNENDITHRALSTGLFHRRELVRTMSEAINIQVPYNMERLLYMITLFAQGFDANRIKSLYHGMEQTGQMDFDSETLDILQDKFRSWRVSDKRMIQTVQKYYNENNYLADPHTAVALNAADQVNAAAEGAPVIILSTAHPCKFAECITEAFDEKFWQDYKVSDAMPAGAGELYNKSPAPTLREFKKEHEDLRETQMKWASELRNMVAGA